MTGLDSSSPLPGPAMMLSLLVSAVPHPVEPQWDCEPSNPPPHTHTEAPTHLLDQMPSLRSQEQPCWVQSEGPTVAKAGAVAPQVGLPPRTRTSPGFLPQSPRGWFPPIPGSRACSPHVGRRAPRRVARGARQLLCSAEVGLQPRGARKLCSDRLPVAGQTEAFSTPCCRFPSLPPCKKMQLTVSQGEGGPSPHPQLPARLLRRVGGERARGSPGRGAATQWQ